MTTNFKFNLHSRVSKRSRHRCVVAALTLVAVFLGVPLHFVFAGSNIPLPQALDPAQVSAAIKANAQALKAFSWQQRLQLQLKGETKKVTLNQMNYDMYGNVQKTLLSEQPPPDSGQQQSGGRLRGRIKQKVVAKKTGEFKDMMNGIAALIKSYTELPPERLQASLKRAAFSQGEGDMGGAVQIRMNGVLQSGDTLILWIDQSAMLFRRITIATSYEGNPVSATANYSMLQSGQVHMAQAILNYPKKDVVVQIDNLSYQPAQ